MNRLSAINNHFSGSNQVSAETITVDGKTYTEVIDNHPEREIKINYFNKQGWGYSDSGFEVIKSK